MLISVIIPLYNKENYIYETIKSILNQSYENFEIIIIDDGSTDKSSFIVSEIQDSRIHLFLQKNHGVAYTRNKGIKIAKGDYILFLDADDFLHNDALKKMILAAKKYSNCNIISGNYLTIKNKVNIENCLLKKNKVLDNPFKEIWFNRWNLRLGSFIVKKDTIKKINFDANILIGEDAFFTDQILINSQVAYIKDIVLSYNRDFSFLSLKKVPVENVYEWYLNFNVDLDKYLKRIYHDKLARKLVMSIIRFEPILSFKLIIKYWKLLPKSLYYFLLRLILSKKNSYHAENSY